MNTKPIYVSRPEYDRLKKFAQVLLASGVKSRGAESLLAELNRATVVDASAVSKTLVTLNAQVRIRDLESDEIEEYTVTMPEDADPAKSRISILSPIGTGLLGYSVGDEVSWETPGGSRVLRIESVTQGAVNKGVVPPYFPSELLGARRSG